MLIAKGGQEKTDGKDVTPTPRWKALFYPQKISCIRFPIMISRTIVEGRTHWKNRFNYPVSPPNEGAD